MNKRKRVSLNSLKFSTKNGRLVLVEEVFMTFANSDYAEKFIQSRFEYWKDIMEIDMVLAPNMIETLKKAEIKKVFQYVAKLRGITYLDIISHSRKPELVQARQFAINICLNRKVQKSTVGTTIGFNHSSVIYHQNEWRKFMEFEEDYIKEFHEAEDFVMEKIDGLHTDKNAGVKTEYDEPRT